MTAPAPTPPWTPWIVRQLVRRIGGACRFAPTDMDALSPAARALIDDAYDGIVPDRIRDYHAHLVGLGTDGTGAVVNPRMLSWRSPIHRLTALVFLSSSGITDEADADTQYLGRLVALLRGARLGKMGLLGFDWFRTPDGAPVPDKSEFHIPDALVFDAVDKHPELFFAIPSVHPYAPDAIARLHVAADRGATMIKWLPNGQGMDASDPALDPYYAAMRDRGLALMTHVGEEKAVEAEDDQALGNPLLFRRPLDAGVKVVMAHCASLGANEDLDDPGRRVDNVDLMLRLMDEPAYDGLLFADISAILQFNRLSGPAIKVLGRTDIHHRLVNGSDYPLPAINFLFSLRALILAGLLDARHRKPLAEIYHVNPLLFDFVLKRAIRHPKTGARFPASVFMEHAALPTWRAAS